MNPATEAKPELAKTYAPEAIEAYWYQYWLDHNFFDSDADPGNVRYPKGPYTIVMPPPNVTGVLHMGHMLNNTIQDVLIRRKRMEGFNACWVPGTDHASIATEARVWAKLKAEGKDKSNTSREEFLKAAWAWTEEYGGIILQQLRKLGCSCDWRRTRFTMEPELTAEVVRVFKALYEKGWIYRSSRLVNWDPQAETAISDEEVVHKEEENIMYYIKYFQTQQEGGNTYDNYIDPNNFLIVATTRPETIPADMAVAVNPLHPQAKYWEGKNVRVPLMNRPIPVIFDEQVEINKGSGFLKITPGHSKEDNEIFERYNFKKYKTPRDSPSFPFEVLDDKAKFTLDFIEGSEENFKNYLKFKGLDRFEARKEIVDLFKKNQLIIKEEITHSNIGYSERTNVVIEPKKKMQWFINMTTLATEALGAVKSNQIKLIPSKFLNTYYNWLENIRDWCISRQLYWGQQIPMWKIADFQEPRPDNFNKGNNFFALIEKEAMEKASIVFPGLVINRMVQDPDVLDTWFSSWLWPMSVFLPAPDKPAVKPGDLEYYYPTNDLVTAPEILFFWVARMIMAGQEFSPHHEVPFKNVYLTGIVRDKLGRKMSKSLGNSPDPLALISQYGADGVRMGMLLAAPAGNDILFDESLCEQGRNFANKLWNAYRLVAGFTLEEKPIEDSLALALQWLRARITEAALALEGQFAEFRLSEALMNLYKLIWDDYCSWYLELLKPAPGNTLSAEAYRQTVACFADLLALLHPFMPFITEELWHALHPNLGERECLIVAQLAPRTEGPEAGLHLEEMARARALVTALRNLRTEKNIPLRQSIDLYIRTADQTWYAEYLPLVQRLIGLGGYTFVTAQPAESLSLIVGGDELYIPIAGLIDTAAERVKVEAEIAYTEGFLESVQRKLLNEKFMANAKPEVITAEQKKQADAETKLALLRQSLAGLGH